MAEVLTASCNELLNSVRFAQVKPTAKLSTDSLLQHWAVLGAVEAFCPGTKRAFYYTS